MEEREAHCISIRTLILKYEACRAIDSFVTLEHLEHQNEIPHG